jgi:hypothetical protein
MPIDIKRALEIPGYMDARDLQWLAQRASTRKRIVEVGSYQGRSTRAMAHNTTGTVWAVDTWECTGELASLRNERPGDWVYESFLSNMRGLLNVVPIRMTSLEASRHFARLGQKFDMVFIDASHDCQSVKQDIEVWKPLLEPGGLLGGHDKNWVEVNKAVNECLPQIPWAKSLGPQDLTIDSIWYTLV